MVQKRDEHKEPVIRAFVALPGETLVEAAARLLPGSGLFVSRSGKEIATNNMNDNHPSQEDHLGFLRQYKSESEMFSLSSGEEIPIQKYFLRFKPWTGAPIPNTYNGKTVIDWYGEPVFAELAVLRLFQTNSWDGVWVDSYRRKYRVGLPDVIDPVELLDEQKQLIESIRSKVGRSGGCWDVFIWKDGIPLFIELKRSKKDKIHPNQNEWLAASLALGLKPDNFALVEWNL